MNSTAIMQPQRSHLIIYNGIKIVLDNKSGKYICLGLQYDTPEQAKEAIDKALPKLKGLTNYGSPFGPAE